MDKYEQQYYPWLQNEYKRQRKVRQLAQSHSGSQDGDEKRTQAARLLAQCIFPQGNKLQELGQVSRFSRCCHPLNVLVLPPNAFTFFMELDESLPPPDSFITSRNHYLPLTQKVICNCWCSNQTGVKDISMIDASFSGKQLKILLL